MKFQILSDEQLIQATAAGDSHAFTELVNRYQTSFFRSAMRILRNEDDAHDAVQSAMSKMFQKAYTFKADGSFGAWSHRVVRNEALMQIRRNKRRSEVDFEAIDPSLHIDSSPLADEIASNEQLRDMLNEAIAKLLPKYKKPFELKVFEGLSVAELSQELKMTEGGIKTRLHRARAQIKLSLLRNHGNEIGAFIAI